MRTKQEVSARISQLLQNPNTFRDDSSGDVWVYALQWVMQEPGPPYSCGESFDRYLAEENSKSGN